ncbi:MAG: peptidoglycan DD-metalloendopeptidase family protein [Chloroflexi bacterium]|nr:peptidoglycan DD-metalloendopeptidase family protein [Chloroflexota bacterium]
MVYWLSGTRGLRLPYSDRTMNRDSHRNRLNGTAHPRERLWLATRLLSHVSVLVLIAAAVLLATAQFPVVQATNGVDRHESAGQPQAEPTAIVLLPADTDVHGEDALQRGFVPSQRPPAEGDVGAGSPAARGLITYTVHSGDTLFGVAAAFGLAPETVLWSNYKTLKDNPHLLSVGMDLLIPPSDGLIAVVEEGDTLDGIARRFQVTPDSLVAEPVNELRDVNQPLAIGQVVFVPGGQRELVVWEVPEPELVQPKTASASGVPVYRVGACGEIAIPALGTGTFIYPTTQRTLSGYNFGRVHPGLDFDGDMGNPIYAADSGTVIFAGDSVNAAGRFVGYGRYVVIDHGNGYQTLYAHSSELYVTCGQQVLKGSLIAVVGSTGNSTGPHLHFELRNQRRAVNPWDFLLP